MHQIGEDKDADKGYKGDWDFRNSKQAKKSENDSDNQPYVGAGNCQEMNRAGGSEHIVNIFGNISGFAQQKSGEERFLIAGQGLIKYP